MLFVGSRLILKCMKLLGIIVMLYGAYILVGDILTSGGTISLFYTPERQTIIQDKPIGSEPGRLHVFHNLKRHPVNQRDMLIVDHNPQAAIPARLQSVRKPPIVESQLDPAPQPADNNSSETRLQYEFRMRSATAESVDWVMMRDKDYEKDIHRRCMKKTYDLSVLPNASIIVSFHESEKVLHLLHTLHSIVENTPAELLHEIILVADNTEKAEHGQPLEDYLAENFPGLVKIYRSKEQLGLIKARLKGINLASGTVAVVMDSHMELQPKWLEALVYEIHLNPKTMATAFLDWMKPVSQGVGTWRYEHGSSRYKTVWFWWNLIFTFMEIPPATNKQTDDPTTAILSPASVGTIWAIDRQFFYECGALDNGMVFWGGENIDLPLRVFLWGGRHVNVPCSHAAHLEEKGQRNYRKGHMKNTTVNYVRVVETWFDEYKDVFYLYNPQYMASTPGDLSERLKLKERASLTFHDFLTKFYPEISAPQFGSFAWGLVTNVGLPKLLSRNVCLCAFPNKASVTMQTCSYHVPHNKVLMWNTRGELRLASHIVIPYGSSKSRIARIDNYVSLFNKPSKIPRWLHWKGGPIAYFNHVTREVNCLEADPDKKTKNLKLKPCDLKNVYQLWTFENYTPEYYQLRSGVFQQASHQDQLILSHIDHLNYAVAQKKLEFDPKLIDTSRRNNINVHVKGR